MVGDKDVLNVRGQPGANSSIVDQLPPLATSLKLTGKETIVGSDRWVEILRPIGSTGWVNANYLTEYVTANSFCADRRVDTLIDNLQTAILTSNGELFSSLVSPLHGLSLHYLRAGTVANYSPAEVKWVFSSTYIMDWGAHPASGLEMKGTFHDEVLPKLVDVLGASYTRTCNNLQTGGTTYTALWPFEYGNINFYTLFRSRPAENELDWRTWLVGIEYVNSKPYIFSLLHFFWEP